MDLPSFVAAGSTRPVDLVRPGALTEVLAPYVAVTAPAEPGLELALASGDDRLSGRYDGAGFSLAVTAGGRTSHHRSRRSGRAAGTVTEVALALTGSHLTVLGREDGEWVVRGRVDLRDRLDTRSEPWLAALTAEGGELRGFGQLGLRDLRLVTRANGAPYSPDGITVWLTATSSGPGFFDTAHASVWTLDPRSLELQHRSDLFFRRPDRPGAYGDNACHLLRDGDRWLVATSTWGDFDPHRRDASVAVTLAESDGDLLAGRHVLDTRPLPLPTTGLRSVGVWDPHLVRTDDGWLAAYVSASRFFRFYPVTATGPSLEALTLRAAATGHRETEGVTLHRLDGEWRVLASDKPGRRYPVFDLDLTELGELDAPYTDNVPWPTLVDDRNGMLMVGFDGGRYGGRLVGYGSHGAVRFAREAAGATQITPPGP